jgi:hypothetical protein
MGMKQVRGSKTTDLHTTGKEREDREERELATMSKRGRDPGERWKNAEEQVLGQRLKTDHLLVQRSIKICTTQVQLGTARVVAMIIEPSTGLHP